MGLEETQALAIKEVVAWQLAEAMETNASIQAILHFECGISVLAECTQNVLTPQPPPNGTLPRITPARKKSKSTP